MAEAFPHYWRVREQIYRSIAASCSTDGDRAVWINLAQGCAGHAEQAENTLTGGEPSLQSLVD
jgi:hypothetical protein